MDSLTVRSVSVVVKKTLQTALVVSTTPDSQIATVVVFVQDDGPMRVRLDAN